MFNKPTLSNRNDIFKGQLACYQGHLSFTWKSGNSWRKLSTTLVYKAKSDSGSPWLIEVPHGSLSLVH